MQIVIDIPDNEYKHIKEYYEKNDTVEATYSYIYHGIPLDNITNEINNLASSPNATSAWYRVAIIDCLKVIDKCRKEQE